MVDFFRRTAISTASVGATRIASLALGFVQSALMARVFGAHELGQWMLVVGFAGVLTLLSRLGLDLALMVRASRLIGEGQYAAAQDAAVVSMQVAFAVGLLPVAVLLLVPDSVALLLGDPAVSALIMAYCGAIVAGQVNAQMVSWLRANGVMILAAFASDTLHTLLHALVLVFLWLGGTSLPVVSFALASVLMQIIVMLVLAGIIQLQAPLPLWPRTSGALRGLWQVAPDFYLITLASTFSAWFVLWMMSLFEGAEQVARFGVAFRIASSVALMFGVVNFVVVPRIAELHAAGDIAGFRRQYDISLWLTVALTLPLLLMIVLFARPLLAIWGPSFALAAPIVRVIAAGELVNAFTGCCGYALNVSGHQCLMKRITINFLWVNLLLCAVLVPAFGISGAAWAVAIRTLMENAAKSWFAWRVIGLRPFPLNLWRDSRS